MRTQARIVVLFFAAVAAIAGVAVYRMRTAGHAEVRDITERVASAMAANDRAALMAEPAFQDHPGTADWLAAHGPSLIAGYRVFVQRNGRNGYQLLSLNAVSHVGIIKTPTGTVGLGFRRDPDGGKLTFVTASASGLAPAPAGQAGGGIR